MHLVMMILRGERGVVLGFFDERQFDLMMIMLVRDRRRPVCVGCLERVLRSG